MKQNIFIIVHLLLFSTFGFSNEMFVVVGTGEAGFEDGNPGKLNKPIRITPFNENSVIIADINNHAIRLVSMDGTVKTIAGGLANEGYLDGDVKTAKFKSPHGVAFNIKTNELKNVTVTYAGVPEKSGFNDGPSNQALFNSPHGIILNEEDELIVADIGNARIRIIQNDVVKTIAGTGSFGQLDGKPTESTFKYPMDMVLGPTNDIIIADAGTNLIRNLVIGKKVSTAKYNSQLNTPHGIACDKEGNKYIADMGTHRILKIDLNGNGTILCGTGEEGSNVEQLNKPAAALVHAGYLWIADLNNHQIKAIKLN